MKAYKYTMYVIPDVNNDFPISDVLYEMENSNDCGITVFKQEAVVEIDRNEFCEDDNHPLNTTKFADFDKAFKELQSSSSK
jgi:hypothetical protein